MDLVATRAGESAGSAIARSVELAQHVEQLGYKRYWVAEHHSLQGLACSATPVLIGHIAPATKTIRVGSGGVMLPNHAPLVVAKQFGTLEAIYPGRIDLGVGRGLLGSGTYSAQLAGAIGLLFGHGGHFAAALDLEFYLLIDAPALA
jgi:luciferase family oxidoreductase group 1